MALRFGFLTAGDNTRVAGRTALIAGTAVLALAAAGCADDSAPESSPGQTSASGGSGGANPSAGPNSESGDSKPDDTATFSVPGSSNGGDDDNTAFTYDEAAVPVGATATVDEEDDNGKTTVTLNANGLAPNRGFGVHVHTKPCGPEPSDSGPHYQNKIDPAATPESSSTDPAYANPQNEVWLDLTSDAQGAAHASSTVNWEFRDGEANSVVLHEEHTMTAPGHAGSAGDRLACVDVDF
ncbi:superoxide dismutase family protein [Gordonia zhaorongruii]|uniref:superoxide dismutase family protein n=1 Tax=Gordonia zhaorongruii TaxID=2597659 RepID=UPI0010455E10|nr:superoxide dismutase family protein [Gordonia zhaorongruii]